MLLFVARVRDDSDLRFGTDRQAEVKIFVFCATVEELKESSFTKENRYLERSVELKA